jgi:hypothetical protein
MMNRERCVKKRKWSILRYTSGRLKRLRKSMIAVGQAVIRTLYVGNKY